MQDPSRPLAEHGSDALDSRLNDLPVIEPIKAANFPCWLMRIISTVVRAEVDRRMEPLGLTQAQWIPVLRLGSGEAQTAADLARSTMQTPGAMTRLIDRLVDNKIIERERSGFAAGGAHVIKVDRAYIIAFIEEEFCNLAARF